MNTRDIERRIAEKVATFRWTRNGGRAVETPAPEAADRALAAELSPVVRDVVADEIDAVVAAIKLTLRHGDRPTPSHRGLAAALEHRACRIRDGLR